MLGLTLTCFTESSAGTSGATFWTASAFSTLSSNRELFSRDDPLPAIVPCIQLRPQLPSENRT